MTQYTISLGVSLIEKFAEEENPRIEWNTMFRSRSRTLEKHEILQSTKTNGKNV